MRLRGSVVVLGLLSISIFVGCGDQDFEPTATDAGSVPVDETTDAVATSSSLAPTTSVVLSQQSLVGVYFMKNELISVVGRLVETPDINQALRSLLLGPNALEIQDGVVSYIPQGTQLLDVKVVEGTALIDVSNEFATGGGSLSMMGRVAEVVYTATSFSEVERVTIRIGGVLVEQIGGEGIDVSDIGRSDLVDFSPLILVDSPVPDQIVSHDIRIQGMSNTFEAGINYQILSTDSTVIYEGYTMASSGTGTWGTFDHLIETLPASVAGDVVLKVFEYSPKDSEPINAVFIPLTVE
jgi:hypothetical protein